MKVVLRTLSAFIRTSLGRYVKPRRYDQIFREIDKRRPRNIMEIGTWKGKRAKQMIEHAAQYNSVNIISYFGFDLFEKIDPNVYKLEISKMPPTEREVFDFLSTTNAIIKLYAGYTQETFCFK